MQDQEGPGDNVVKEGQEDRNQILLGTPQKGEQWWRQTPAELQGLEALRQDTLAKKKCRKRNEESGKSYRKILTPSLSHYYSFNIS